MLPGGQGARALYVTTPSCTGLQAYFILSDPWANSYRSSWIQPDRLGKFERQIGRGGWIATRNFEVDRWAPP